jgi:hypothetical protein
VHSTVTYIYVVLIQLNDDADPRSEDQHFLLSSSRCLDPLVRKRKGTPKNASNQVIIREENVKIEKERKYRLSTKESYKSIP